MTIEKKRSSQQNSVDPCFRDILTLDTYFYKFRHSLTSYLAQTRLVLLIYHHCKPNFKQTCSFHSFLCCFLCQQRCLPGCGCSLSLLPLLQIHPSKKRYASLTHRSLRDDAAEIPLVKMKCQKKKKSPERTSQTPGQLCVCLKEHMYFMKICCHPPPQ